MDDADEGGMAKASRSVEAARRFVEIMAKGAGAEIPLDAAVETARGHALDPEAVLVAVISTMVSGHSLEAHEIMSRSGDVVILVAASERAANPSSEVLLEPPGLAAMERLFTDHNRHPMVLVGGGRRFGKAMADALDFAVIDLERPDRKSWETPYGPPRRSRVRGGP